MTPPPKSHHLPIDDVLDEVVASLGRGPNLVLKAPTGAGKTTRVAPALLDLAQVRGDVLLLEPRRVAARAAARRIAFERGCEVGGEVGHHVRFDRRCGATTRLVAMTSGIFLARLQDDPLLEGVGAVVFDEFHERSLDVDLALAMARRIQCEVREDLRLVVMSATLDTAPIASFLGGAPVLESRGRAFPVEVRHRGVAASADRRETARLAAFALVAAVEEALDETKGDVLVFLPGVGEIRRAREDLSTTAASRGLDLRELYGDLAPEEQDAVLRAGPRRKVVLATNVAESSVTIENVTAVVDTGTARTMRMDASVGIDRLELGRISRASAEQRRGRAGRTSPGLCIRLWSAHEDLALRPVEEAEVRRVDLSRAVLELRAWGEPSARDFAWFEAPDASALDHALALLVDLGAIGAGAGTGKEGPLTDAGRRLARLPLSPRLGSLLLEGARLGVAGRGALAAALLAERDPTRGASSTRDGGGEGHASALRGSAATHESDLLERVLLLERFAASNHRAPSAWPGLSTSAALGVLRVARELASLVREPPPRTPPADADEALLRAVLAAFPDRVARRREPASDRAVMVGGRGLRLGPASAVRASALFVAVDVEAGRRGERSESVVRVASAIEREWLDPSRSSRGVELEFDDESGAVVAFSRTRWRDLVLDEKPVATPRDAAGALLGEKAAADPARALDLADEEVAAWLARVRSLAAWMPELSLPTFEDEGLAEVARSLASGRRSFEEMRRAPLLDELRSRLDWQQRRALDEHAPERIVVPSGSAIRLEYAPGRPPVLAARIQEMFGMAETPRVAAGRVAVVVHLLAPSGRPQQVTEDLASFWSGAYAEVRKELRARYPKHSWPEDPRTAKAERRPGALRR